MELRQLENFVAVAEDGSFTRAARRLNYVQSALSVSIQSLERELGVRLFDRTTHRVVLTSAGEALLPSARQTLASAEETRDVAAAVKGVLRGRLRVGVMQSFAFADVPSALGRFHRLHPDVEISLHPAIGGSTALIEELRQGAIDIAFVALDDAPSMVSTIPLGSEDLVFVAASEFEPPGRGAIQLEKLSTTNFIDFPTGWGVRSVIDRSFASIGIDRQVTIEVADVSTLLQLVRAGLGVALLPPTLLVKGDRYLKIRKVEPTITWHVVMAIPSSRSASAPAKTLADMITESIGQ